jgi:hypothetical protein
VLLIAALTFAAPLLYFNGNQVQAESLESRELTLSNPEAGATSNYTFSFEIQQMVSYGSLEFEFCSNSPIPGQPCTPPTGFDASAAILSLQNGETGFSISGVSTANRLVLTRSATVPTVQTSTYRFNGIINPSTPQSTNYVRLANFASTNGTGPRIDEGGIAFSTSDDFDINLFVPPYLSFCAGKDITGLNCSTVSGNRINFGVLSPAETKSDTSKFVITTNAALGYNISVTGPTMTSGNNTIDNLASATPPNLGAEQFGMNLRSNTSPAAGSNPTGLVTGGATSGYNSPNLFRYNNGDIIASSDLPDATSYTATYIVNVPVNQIPGVYTTTLTYVAFASF